MRYARRRILGLLARVLACLGLAAGATSCWMGPWPGEMDEAQVGFLYVGPVGDHGWTKAHDDGREYLESQLDGVTTQYQPSVIAADAGGVMEEFIAGGDNVLITTSFDFLSATQTAAANHPEAHFLNCSGFVSSPNLGSYFGRMYQVWYLAGIVAGHMTEQSGSDRIGVVGPVVIPETVRHLNALTLGARSVNPDVVVHVEWIHNWFDIEQEPLVTEALIAAGADVIVSKTDTTIPLETVDALSNSEQYPFPVYSIGYDNEDSCEFAPDTCLTAPYWNWGPLYTRLVEQMLEGSWDPYQTVWDQVEIDRNNSTVYLAEIHEDVPTSVVMQVEETFAQLSQPENTHLPFLGPLHDADGDKRVSTGDEMADEELLRMCWYVEGVIAADGSPAEVPGGCGGDY
jgi:basic membrane protein A and related proteins